MFPKAAVHNCHLIWDRASCALLSLIFLKGYKIGPWRLWRSPSGQSAKINGRRCLVSASTLFATLDMRTVYRCHTKRTCEAAVRFMPTPPVRRLARNTLGLDAAQLAKSRTISVRLVLGVKPSMRTYAMPEATNAASTRSSIPACLKLSQTKLVR